MLLRYAHDHVRNLLGEELYAKVAGPLMRGGGGVARKFALAEFEARDVGPKGLDLYRLVESDRAMILGLAVSYAYGSFAPGDLVEFGTAAGITARAIARAMIASERSRAPKRFHLFDSFEGHPEVTSDVDRNSYEVTHGIWKPGFPRLMSKDELRRSLAKIVPADRLTMHQGWFKDTVVGLPAEQKFSLVHFHGDLYQSAIDAVATLFDRGMISNGAIVCLSGYYTGQANPTTGEGGAWRKIVVDFDVNFTPWRAYGDLGQSFIIHGYRRAA
jgi:O-methyltransferase